MSRIRRFPPEVLTSGDNPSRRVQILETCMTAGHDFTVWKPNVSQYNDFTTGEIENYAVWRCCERCGLHEYERRF